jgi:hypothetical protein
MPTSQILELQLQDSKYKGKNLWNVMLTTQILELQLWDSKYKGKNT